MATTGISVQLDLEIARALHAQRHTPAADAVRHAVDEAGVTLRPLHPGQTHELLAPFFVVEAPDRASAEHIAARLRKVAGVEGAWVHPSQAIP